MRRTTQKTQKQKTPQTPQILKANWQRTLSLGKKLARETAHCSFETAQDKRRISEDAMLKDRDVISIVSAKKRG
jgi:hypothetical protein